MLPLEIHSAAPSRTHLKSKIMETNGFKSNFRNVIKDSLGQLWLSVRGSKHIQTRFGVACQIRETFFFFPTKRAVCSNSLPFQKGSKLTREEGNMDLAFIICGTFCAFKK